MAFAGEPATAEQEFFASFCKKEGLTFCLPGGIAPAVSQNAISRWSIRRLGLTAWLAVLLVLSSHDAAPKAGALSALEAATIFCRAGSGADHHKPVLPHSLHEPAVLQAGLANVQHIAILAPAPALLGLPATRAARPGLPQVRAPPAHRFAAAYPRGPPVPV